MMYWICRPTAKDRPKANGLKLEVLEANKAAEEECARENDAKGN